MDFDQLNQAVKFGRDEERAAFEQAIDKNPLESTNHLVYADWLEENGEQAEAEFRRAMGEWFGKRKPYNAPLYLPDGFGLPENATAQEILNFIRGGAPGSLPYDKHYEASHSRPDDKWRVRVPWNIFYDDGSGRVRDSAHFYLPEGVLPEHIPLKRTSREDVVKEFGSSLGTTSKTDEDPAVANNPFPDETGEQPPWVGNLFWKDYRHMEEAFRRAFMKNRSRPAE